MYRDDGQEHNYFQVEMVEMDDMLVLKDNTLDDDGDNIQDTKSVPNNYNSSNMVHNTTTVHTMNYSTMENTMTNTMSYMDISNNLHQ